MTYELATEIKGDVLWVTATGARSRESVLAMAKDILTACAERKVMRALVDVRALQGRLAPADSYEIVTGQFPRLRDPRVITQAALVDLKEFEDSYRFFEDVAVNRGFNIRIFSDPEKAAEWLGRAPGA